MALLLPLHLLSDPFPLKIFEWEGYLEPLYLRQTPGISMGGPAPQQRQVVKILEKIEDTVDSLSDLPPPWFPSHC